MTQNSSQRPKRTSRVDSVTIGSFVVTFESDRFYQNRRCYWMICAAQNPDELVSWGHAPTRELAETVAVTQVENLFSGPAKTGASPARASQSLTEMTVMQL